LSAVEALLTTLRTPQDGGRRSRLVAATGQGLHVLLDRLLAAHEPVPDTPAVDLIVPALVDRRRPPEPAAGAW
jgi:hypothetical protein